MKKYTFLLSFSLLSFTFGAPILDEQEQVLNTIDKIQDAQEERERQKQLQLQSAALDSTSRDFSASSAPIQPTQPQEPPTEQDILLKKQAIRSQNLNAIQNHFFSKNYTGTENTITIDYEENNTYKIRARKP